MYAPFSLAATPECQKRERDRTSDDYFAKRVEAANYIQSDDECTQKDPVEIVAATS
jgi:hypothetical protein